MSSVARVESDESDTGCVPLGGDETAAGVD